MQQINKIHGSIIPTIEDLQLLNSIFPVSRETLEMLQCYVDLLIRWQNKTNLISSATIPQIWQRHICDSVQCFALLSDKNIWLDIGSGAGLPGLVIAILARERKDFQIYLVESNQKKCAFLREALNKTGLETKIENGDSQNNQVQIIPKRIESATKQIRNIDVVIARAVTKLDDLIKMGEPWLQESAIGLFPKGRDFRKEIADSNRLQGFDLIEHKSRVEKDSILLEISKRESDK